ncbi:hypothetical protein ACRC7T_02125 [Segnochrobactraceae bacterium EtOH-i3]
MDRCRAPGRPAGLIALLAGLFLLAQALVFGASGAAAMPAHAHGTALSGAAAGHAQAPCHPGDGLARIACAQHCTLAAALPAPVLPLPVRVALSEPLPPSPVPAGHVPGVAERPPR